jgi:hypothetical protein
MTLGIFNTFWMFCLSWVMYFGISQDEDPGAPMWIIFVATLALMGVNLCSLLF